MAAAWPQGYCATKSLVQDFSSLTGFSVNSGGAMELSTSYVKEGTGSIKLTTRSGAFSELECTTDATSRLGRFTARFYVEDYTKLVSIVMYLGTDDSYTSFATYTYNFSGTDHQFNGWHVLDWQDLAADSSDAFSPSAFPLNRTFARWKFRVTPQASVVGDVWFDAFWVDAKPRTSVIITADDGYDSWFNDGVPILDAAGLLHTHSVIGSLVDTAGYVTSAQLASAYATGHEFAVHGETNLSLLGSASAIYADIAENKEFLEARGYTRATKFYVYPNGVYQLSAGDTTIRDALTAQGFVAARTVETPLYGLNTNRRGVQTALLDTSLETYSSRYYPDRMRLSIIGHDGTADTPSTIQARVLECIKFGTSAILMFHKVGSGATTLEVSSADLTSIVATLKQYKQAGLIDVPTLSRWHLGLTQPQAVAG